MSALPPAVAVGVFPAAELDRRRALFGALEGALPVRFEGREAGHVNALAAVVELGGRAQAEAAASTGLRALALLQAEPPSAGRSAAQKLADVHELDSRLRGAELPDAWLGPALESDDMGEVAGATVLASCDGAPAWIRAGALDLALLAPAELGEDEALRERLCDGRSAALLPLLCFLRELTAAIRWQPPRPRATLLFDDPNLHRSSYGFLDLPRLAAHAREHGYHVALAMVPLDGWFASAAARRALVESAGSISLLVHGNDHNGGELGRQATEEEGLRLAAQALRRIDAFERRTGVAVDRVMVPPHEQCSEAAALGVLRCGFEAITMTRPFPWLAEPPRSWLSRPAEAGPLVGWHPGDFAGQLPVLLRHPLRTRDAPELVLRAFLDQPLILYGHHEDVAPGLGVLAEAAADVNRLGPTRWSSVGEIAAGHFETRCEGPTLAVRPYSRRVRVAVPEGIDHLRVELPAAHPGAAAERLTVDGEAVPIAEQVAVPAGSAAELRLHAVGEVDPGTVPAPPRQPLALARRTLGEGRDRLLPLLERVR